MKLPKFEIDARGFKQIQGGREPWRLSKELISNSWDEKEVTKVDASVDRVTGMGLVKLQVIDDGLGFRDLSDAYTFYRSTPKRLDPTVRGVFNRGEKELLAAAKSGIIETTSGTVAFDEDSRTESPKKRKRGTSVTVYMDWTDKEMNDVIQKLRNLVPPTDKTYTVNGLAVPQREVLYAVEATLDTVLLHQDGLMRPTRRKTIINVYNTYAGETPMLFEMGILVQELDKQEVPWHLDVQQKIPLAPNRDSVRPAYLQDVLAEVLNHTASKLDQTQASGTWVKEAIGDERVSAEAVKQVFDTQYEGRAMVGNPLDSLAMERAQQAGMIIIHPRSLTAAERARLKETGAIKNVSEIYGLKDAEAKPYKPTAAMLRVEAFVHKIAPELVGRDVKVRFVTMAQSYGSAYCGTGTLTFVVNKLGKDFFEGCLSERHLDLIYHELAHENQDRLGSANPHGQEFVNALSALGALATFVMKERPGLFKL